MANLQGASNIRNPQTFRKSPILPPKSPFQPATPSCTDYGSGHFLGPVGMPIHWEGLKPHQHHQRTTSENFLMEEQPSWLDDLLNEPEIPAKRGAHRRSTSDSFAYLDTLNSSWNLDHVQFEDFKNQSVHSLPLAAEECDGLKDIRHSSHYLEAKSTGQDPGMKRVIRPGTGFQPSTPLKQVHPLPASVSEKQTQDESSLDLVGSSDKKDMTQTKNIQTDLEAKRAKQQFAQRSRVRKLQYIAELERHVQALQAEGMEFSAQLHFLDQQNLMLNLENKVLKQQLDNLSQEHLVKCLQQEMLERDISRLRALYHNQQQQQKQQQKPPPPVHRRNKSRDLELQLANLSIKQTETNSGADGVNGPFHT